MLLFADDDKSKTMILFKASRRKPKWRTIRLMRLFLAIRLHFVRFVRVLSPIGMQSGRFGTNRRHERSTGESTSKKAIAFTLSDECGKLHLIGWHVDWYWRERERERDCQ
jgi:hypothetical protein